MNASGYGLEAASRRRSRNVALVLLGAVGVVGGLAAWQAWRRSQAIVVTEVPPPPVVVDRVYVNNEYIVGLGWYHAAYRAWYPHPYNFFDPVRGYFAGGLWQPAPYGVVVINSRPHPDALIAAVALQRLQRQQYDDDRRRYASSSSPASGGAFHNWSAGRSTPTSVPPSSVHPTANSSSPRPSTGTAHAAAPSGASSISRGGFGGSAHASGGGGSS